jgi:hypothetical protein
MRTTALSTFGGGENAPAGTPNSSSARATAGHVHGQRAVLLAPRRCDESLCDLALHEIHGAIGAWRRECVKEDRRRDVVRHVADEDVRSRGKIAEVRHRDVGLGDQHVASARVALAQQRRELRGRTRSR